MIRVITYWPSWSPKERTEEFKTCLEVNEENPLIDSILVVTDKDIHVGGGKVHQKIIGKREPQYTFMFHLANEMITEDGDITIITNGDIYFDETLSYLRSLSDHQCFALSRWNMDHEGFNSLYDRPDSQDCWIFRGKIKNIEADFPLGALGCDNRIAYEIHKAGYEIKNPSKTIKTVHIHLVQTRQAVGKPTVPDPYKYLPPDYLRPFMSIVTRHMLSRPVMFQQNVDSVNMQDNQDLEHIIILDDAGLGSGRANIMFYRNMDRVSGDYVFMLDDDDVLVTPDFISDMKGIVKGNDVDVIMIRMMLNGELYPTPIVWKKQPIMNHIGTSNFVIKNAVWKKHIRNFLPIQTGDYNFIRTVFDSRPKVTWVDKIYSKTLRVSCGLPE